jgi:hypothetical protein
VVALLKWCFGCNCVRFWAAVLCYGVCGGCDGAATKKGAKVSHSDDINAMLVSALGVPLCCAMECVAAVIGRSGGDRLLLRKEPR